MKRLPHRRLDYEAIGRAALAHTSTLLPGGHVERHAYVALNPKRLDRHKGSFRINLRTGQWADFAIEARGGDLISLAAYLFDLPQPEAARRVAHELGACDGTA